ncbi:MAG: hypothetical protein A2W01_07880 [Candidatus Solincola sediminis]|nr:MAG: hypothetical protein A2W01_07880 [Candidatus Solincola sediminis]
MAKGIIDVLPHSLTVGLEAFQFEGLPFPDFSQHMQLIAPEEIVKGNPTTSLHVNHLILNIDQL